MLLRYLLASAPMFTCLFWCLALVLDRRHHNRGKSLLTVFMFVAAIHFFCQAAFCTHQYSLTYRIDTLYFYVTLSVFPLYYLYIRALTDRKKLSLRSMWVFAPALLLGTAAGVLYLLMSPAEAEAFVRERLYREDGSWEFSLVARLQMINLRMLDVLFALSVVLVGYHGIRRIDRYNKEIADYYSDEEGKVFVPQRRWLWAFVYAAFASTIFNAIGRWAFTDPVWMLLIASFFFVAMLFPLGLIGFRQNFTVEDIARDEARADHANSPMVEELLTAHESRLRTNALKVRMIELIEGEELFKNPGLCITDLAAQLGTNRSYVSRIINQELQTSFSDMINSYRVEYAKKLLCEPQPLPMLISDVAEKAGFSSESSFYRIFKNSTGHSPKAWLGRRIAGG